MIEKDHRFTRRCRGCLRLVTSLGLVNIFWALPPVAYGHHSFAMFDGTKQTVLTGTVREFQFTNPHCFIQLLVEGLGGTKEWSIEMSNPANLVRNGWRKDTVKPGDRITVTMHPLRQGKVAGGSFVSAVDAKGKPLGGTQQ